MLYITPAKAQLMTPALAKASVAADCCLEFGIIGATAGQPVWNETKLKNVPPRRGFIINVQRDT